MEAHSIFVFSAGRCERVALRSNVSSSQYIRKTGKATFFVIHHEIKPWYPISLFKTHLFFRIHEKNISSSKKREFDR